MEVQRLQEMISKATSFNNDAVSGQQKLKDDHDMRAKKAAVDADEIAEELKNVMKKKAELEAKIGGLSADKDEKLKGYEEARASV